jgi:hypothetical protein
MKVTPKLKLKLRKAVKTSMCIEGYGAAIPVEKQAEAKALMERRRVQVSVPRK